MSTMKDTRKIELFDELLAVIAGYGGAEGAERYADDCNDLPNDVFFMVIDAYKEAGGKK